MRTEPGVDHGLRRRVLIAAAALAVLALAAVGVLTLTPARSLVADGNSLSQGTKMTMGLTHVKVGETVYFHAPGLANLSDAPLTIRSLEMVSKPPGLQPLPVRVYKSSAFAGPVPVAWRSGSTGSSADDASDPGRYPWKPLTSLTLSPGDGAEGNVIMFAFTVRSPGHLEAQDVRVTYEQHGATWRQTIPVTYIVE